jgi:glutamate decarboxylase
MNLASFVTTWMEPEAEKLMKETMAKNIVDMNIYPQTMEIHDRCVSMIANLFHATEKAPGTMCVGSSEALMLGSLALKKKWQAWRKQNGKLTRPDPLT